MGIFVRKAKSGFRLIEEKWKPKRHVKAVPREAYSALGFSHEMTFEEAKERATILNTQSQLESQKIAATARRVERDKLVDMAYLPKKMVSLFLDELELDYEDNPDRLETIMKHWNQAQILISAVELDPRDFFKDKKLIYAYYRKKAWSPDYCKRITGILNRWGSFCSNKTDSYFKPIPKMSGTLIEKIQDIRDEKGDVRTEAKPLIWSDLKNKRAKFKLDGLMLDWNWLFIGLWFGLRPEEIDSLKNKKNLWKVENDPERKVDVLWVYQTKLTNIPKEKRWKPIPILFPEQKEALEIIKSGEFERPLNKTIQTSERLGPKIESYSPRKGFTDLMLDKGYSIEDISIFLGHENIATTWKHYKNKKKFKLPNAG